MSRSCRRPIAVRFIQALSRLYPESFRVRFAASLVETFGERWEACRRGSSLPARLFFLLRESGAIAAAAFAQRVQGWSRRSSFVLPGTASERAAEPLSTLIREFLQALRRLLRQPTFSLATIVTLALGVGANAAIFNVVYGIILSPLPYPEADRLVWLDHGAGGLKVERGLKMTTGLFAFYRDRNRTLEDIAIFEVIPVSLTGAGDPERLDAVRMTWTVPDVLRTPPAMGRWFDKMDDYTDGTGVAVLSYGLWQRRFGGDPEALGTRFELNDIPFRVVGVAPRHFHFPEPRVDLWVPMALESSPTRLGGFTLDGIGRLRPGVTPEQVEADLDALIRRLPYSRSSMVDDVKLYSRIVPLKEELVGGISATLWVLLGTASFVLLGASANVANLFLVRAESRHREMAVRMAVGAGRLQMARHFLIESAIVCAASAAVAIGLTFVGLRALVRWGPEDLPRLHELGIGSPVLLYMGVLLLAAMLVFAAAPLLRRVTLSSEALRESGGRLLRSGRRRAHNLLVVSQMALGLMLLVGAGLMVRSYGHLRRLEPGFAPESVLAFQLGLPRNAYPERSAAVAFHQQLLDRLEGQPGVVSVAAVTCLPLCGSWAGNTLAVQGRSIEPGTVPPVVSTRRVSAGYFETMRIPLLSGRTLERADQDGRSGAAVVSAETARRYWPGEDPIGKRVYHGSVESESDWYTVVGVVGNVPVRALTDGPIPAIYLPLLHRDGDRGISPYQLDYVIRTSIAPLELADDVRRELWHLNPNLPIAGVRPLDQIVAASNALPAFTMALLITAAAGSLLLGAIGIYGVISFLVAQRRAEIGVRLALGAREADIRRMVLRHGGAVALAGVVLGVAGALAATRLMEALLFGVGPADPPTFVVAAVILLAVALVATYLPARRASQTDPMTALRME